MHLSNVKSGFIWRLKIGIIAVMALMPAADACTTFSIDQDHHAVFGRNYDWPVDTGLAMVNKRAVNKSAVVIRSGEPARWTSRYGSLTFNQYGRELPNGGINEKGLVVEVMWLKDATYPAPDSRPAINTLSWIQYQLDTASTVAEVIASDAKIRITPEFGPKLHYFVCESGGTCATIEFINGALVAHTGGALPLPVLTNNTYADSMAYFSSGQPHSRAMDEDSAESLPRFNRAASMLKAYATHKDAGPEVDYAFDILKNVAMPRLTQWSIVYDQTAQQVYFRTRANPQIRSVKLADMDFSCKTPMSILDINAKGAGDVHSSFIDYTEKANRDLIEQSFRHTDLTQGIPASVLDRVAAHPDNFTCA